MRTLTLNSKIHTWIAERDAERASLAFIVDALVNDDEKAVGILNCFREKCQSDRENELRWDPHTRFLTFGTAIATYFVYGADGLHLPTIMVYQKEKKRVHHSVWKFWTEPQLTPRKVEAAAATFAFVCPDDVWRNCILRKYLTASDILSIRLVNKAFCRIASHDSVWIDRIDRTMPIDGSALSAFLSQNFILSGEGALSPERVRSICLERGKQFISLLGHAWVNRYATAYEKYFPAIVPTYGVVAPSEEGEGEPPRKKTSLDPATYGTLITPFPPLRRIRLLLGFAYSPDPVMSHGVLVWITPSYKLRVASPSAKAGHRKIPNMLAWIRETIHMYLK